MRNPVMGAEDFSYVLKRVPGSDGVPGRHAGRPATGHGPANHSNKV